MTKPIMGRLLCGMMYGFALPLFAACAPSSLVEVDPPSGVVDPSVVQTPAGATQVYNYAVNNFAFVYGGNVATCAGTFFTLTGVASDELMFAGTGTDQFDNRNWSSICTSAISPLYHQPRVEALQARQALALYTPSASPALQARLYAIEAYSILMFAELYCSGIPLSTVTLTGVTTPTAGFTTEELFARAAALFDTAITMAGDSARFGDLARVGKGRALLGLGKFAEAATAVQGVSTTFVYTLDYGATNVNRFGNAPRAFFSKDREGTNGLVWSSDPRTAIVTTPALSGAMPYSAKYSKTAAGTLDPTQAITNNPVWLASGTEARLIEAEADLAGNGTAWLTMLNSLRSTCIGASPCAPVPGLTTANLPALADPGTANSRIDLLMKERAMWLYLTGHRFGDLRRLAHVYHRDKETLWPTGVYLNPGFPPFIISNFNDGTSYGSLTVFSTDGTTSEALANPLYRGCINLDP